MHDNCLRISFNNYVIAKDKILAKSDPQLFFYKSDPDYNRLRSVHRFLVPVNDHSNNECRNDDGVIERVYIRWSHELTVAPTIGPPFATPAARSVYVSRSSFALSQ